MTRPACIARSCSIDLRERALARTDAVESRRSMAKALSVSLSAVIKWDQRRVRTGGAAPGRMVGHRKLKLAGDHADWLRRPIHEEPFTLGGLLVALRGAL